MSVGDRVLEIDGIDCYSLTESQAISFLRRPSNSIELLVLKRRFENVVPPKRSSSCKALLNFGFPKKQSISEPVSPSRRQTIHTNEQIAGTAKKLHALEESSKSCFEKLQKDPAGPIPSSNNHDTSTQFSNFRPRRNSLQKDGEPVCLRSRSSSPQFWKVNAETSTTGPSSDCKSFWKKLEKCSMEDLSARHTSSPVRPASVAFYPKTPEPVAPPTTEGVSPKKKVKGILTILLYLNYSDLYCILHDTGDF